jgi:hypothetical protein
MISIEVSAGCGDQTIYDYLLKNEKSLLYVSPRFIKLISDHLSAQPFWIIARRGDRIVGLMPYLVKFGPLGNVYNSLPYYGSNGGVVQHTKDNEAKLELLRAFYDHAKNDGACSATLITNPLENDAEFYSSNISFDFRDERTGQITHLNGITSEDKLMQSFKDPRHRNIRKAIKEGVIVERGQSQEAIDFLYMVHQQNINSIGGIAKDRDFFTKLTKIMMAKDWCIYTAYLNDKPIASLLLLYFNRTVEYFTPVIVEEYRGLQPLALIIFRAMSDAILQGYSNWNWGGTWLTQDGVYDFKKRWGTMDYPYFYYTKIFSSSLIQQTTSFFLDHYKGFYVIPFNQLEGKNTRQ